VGEHRDFKFASRVDHSKFQPTVDKQSLKGAWSCHVTHCVIFSPPKISMELRLQIGCASWL